MLTFATRDFARDLQRLTETDGSAEDTGTPSTGAAPSSDPRFGNFASIASGPTANRIVQIALARERNPSTQSTSRYNPSGPTVACASFVSTVLREAGAFHQANDFTRWCPDLPTLLSQGGAIQVVPSNTPTSESNIFRMEPGDVILFHRSGSNFKHTGIYIGNGEMVDTSSSEQRLKRRPVRHLAGTYSYFAAYRYSR